MTLDRTIIPNPAAPDALDAYGSAPGRHELVVASCRYVVPDHGAQSHFVTRYYLRGAAGEVPMADFMAFVASHELQPTGRMTTTETP